MTSVRKISYIDTYDGVGEIGNAIDSIYVAVLQRNPSSAERSQWIEAIHQRHIPLGTLIEIFRSSTEATSMRSGKGYFVPGHYHSPIVRPDEAVKRYVARELTQWPEDLRGIDVNIGLMEALWKECKETLVATPFGDTPDNIHRYCYTGGPFPHGDGIAARMVIAKYRPKRIIEIGSGHSTACMLDALDEFGLEGTHVTCVDPDMSRLRTLLRDGDESRITLREELIQDVSPDLVDELSSGDILFIDSTHVVKTGSDVHFEFFHLIPRLRSGVIVHVHDIMYPFEYPSEWVFDLNYSWNETYLLRAFLMYNTEFRVIFWNSMFARFRRQEVLEAAPAFLVNPGGSIWLQRN